MMGLPRNKAAAGQTWAIVLAAGNGTRLSSLTRDDTGAPVPKQFCSLDGVTTLLERTRLRAAAVVGDERVIAVVSAAHRLYWERARPALPEGNFVVQPQDRGTGMGVLLPALHIMERDPEARIVVLPSDHHVADEDVLECAMRTALEDIRGHPAGVALLGIEADEPDPDLGYIVPGDVGPERLQAVRRFVEKPPAQEACRLIRAGAMWNSFILACRGRSLIELFADRCEPALRSLRAVGLRDATMLRQIYADCPSVDFSRDIATGREARLAVMPVASCGWNDLGTPHRLARTLARGSEPQRATAPAFAVDGHSINLAERLARMHPATLTHCMAGS